MGVEDRQPTSRRRDFQPNVLRNDRKHLPTGASISHEKKAIRKVDSLQSKSRQNPLPSKLTDVEAVLYATTADHVDRAANVIANAINPDPQQNITRRKKKDKAAANHVSPADPTTDPDTTLGDDKKDGTLKEDEEEEDNEPASKPSSAIQTVPGWTSFIASITTFSRMLLAEITKSWRAVYAWFTARG